MRSQQTDPARKGTARFLRPHGMSLRTGCGSRPPETVPNRRTNNRTAGLCGRGGAIHSSGNRPSRPQPMFRHKRHNPVNRPSRYRHCTLRIAPASEPIFSAGATNRHSSRSDLPRRTNGTAADPMPRRADLHPQEAQGRARPIPPMPFSGVNARLRLGLLPAGSSDCGNRRSRQTGENETQLPDGGTPPKRGLAQTVSAGMSSARAVLLATSGRTRTVGLAAAGAKRRRPVRSAARKNEFRRPKGRRNA